MESLATKYRPKTFEEVCSQESIITILERQLELNQFKHSYLFCGASGCGKTTLARIFANEINNHVGNPIEIDGASNNGVENVKNIISTASERSLEGKYKIFIIDECVTGDTEVLTENGWCRFDQLTHNEKIAQYTTNGAIEFVTPLEYIEKDYSGSMYNIKIGNKATFTMSPNHVQPLYYTKSKQIKETYIKDTKFAQSNKFIRSGSGIGELDELSALDKLAIALQADGCLQGEQKDHNYWTIQVVKQIKKVNLVKLLQNAGVEYKLLNSIRENVIRYGIKTPKNITKKLNTYFHLEQMSEKYAYNFIEELMLWDGYHKNKYYYYSCIDKENVDFCQCVGILGGFKSRIGIQYDNRKETYKDSYRLYLEYNRVGTANTSITKNEITFTGKIYCVKVPSHMIIIRKDGFELITGNCHSLTSQAWQAFLKCLEEPPEFTIFIFCTTDPQKIPATILNRVLRFNFTRINTDIIINRLKYICQAEHFTNYEVSCDYIGRLSAGCMRDAISMLDKVAGLSSDINIDNTLKALGDFSYDLMLDLLRSIQESDERNVLAIINYIYNQGNDLKLFIDQFLTFCLDVSKIILFDSITLTKIPNSLEADIKKYTNFENASQYYLYIINKLFECKNIIKTDSNIKTTIEIYLLNMCRDNHA